MFPNPPIPRRLLLTFAFLCPLLLFGQERGTQKAQGTIVADTTGAWFTPGQQFVRIPVGHDGIYRLTYNDLATAGALPATLNLQSADLFYKGRSVSFRVIGDA